MHYRKVRICPRTFSGMLKSTKKIFRSCRSTGEAVMDLLDAAPGSRVVDLGCGNGALTEQLAACGYDVAGVDASAEMLELLARVTRS